MLFFIHIFYLQLSKRVIYFNVCLFFILRVTISSFYHICLIFNLKFGGLIPFRWEHFNNIFSFSCTVSRKLNINMCTIISLILETECVFTTFCDSRTWNTCWYTLLCTSMETLILWAIYMDVLDPGSWFLWYTVWNRILSANAERII